MYPRWMRSPKVFAAVIVIGVLIGFVMSASPVLGGVLFWVFILFGVVIDILSRFKDS